MPTPRNARQTTRPRPGKKRNGFGLALLIVFLASSVLMATSMAMTVSPAMIDIVKQASLDNASAKALAEQALSLAQADMITKMKAGTTLTSSYRYPASGTNTISMPTYPGGTTSTKGSYYVTATLARGFTYLLTVYATVGNAQIIVPRLLQFSSVPNPYLNAFGVYALRKLVPSYSGSAVQVRCPNAPSSQAIGFDSNGDFDVATFRTNCLGQAEQYPLSLATPTPKFAYSLRKIKSDYAGPAIRVRRSSGSPTTQDIYFDSTGNLDVTALRTFVGSGSGYVTTWYDQSGYGRDATQLGTSSSQPTIVNSGVLYTINGAPSMYFDGTDDYMANISLPGSYITGSDITSFVVARQDRTTTSLNYARYIALHKSNTNTDASGLNEDWQVDGGLQVLGVSDSSFSILSQTKSTAVIGDSKLSANVPFQATSFHTNSGTFALYKDSVMLQTRSFAATFSPTDLYLGTGGYKTGASGDYLKGGLSEVIIYNNALTTERPLIEKNETNYFNTGTQGAYISTWYDQSGNGRNLTQATANNQPVLTLNGTKPGLFFSSNINGTANSYLQNNALSLTTDKLTMMASANISSHSSPQYGRAISLGKTGDSNDYNSATSTALLMKEVNQLATERVTALLISPNIIFQRDFQATVLFDGTNRTIRAKQNGNLSATTTSNGSGNLVINILRVGHNALTAADSSEAWKGNIYEFALFPTIINASIYQTIESDQQSYFGIN